MECTQKGLSLVAVMEANRKPQTASGDEVNVDMEATAKRLKEAAEIRQR